MDALFFPLASGSEGSSDPGDRQVEWLQNKMSARRIFRNRKEGREKGQVMRGREGVNKEGAVGGIQP